jgi:pimeloyl-ACP methyl ester carboxylesterase
MAELLHQEIAGSSLTVIEDGRHLTPLEHPGRIAEEIRCIMGGKKS